MVRTLFGLSLVALVAVTCGCRMCADPYDYCGPLFTGDCCGPPCAPYARAGSILSCGCQPCGGPPCGCQSVPGPVMAPGATGPAPGELVPVPDDYVGPAAEPIPAMEEQADRVRPTRQARYPQRCYRRTAYCPHAMAR